jgi:hypothetical protein
MTCLGRHLLSIRSFHNETLRTSRFLGRDTGVMKLEAGTLFYALFDQG